MADWLGKASSAGGLGWGDGAVTGLGLALFAALVAYLTLTRGDVEGAHATHQHDGLSSDGHPGPPVSELDPALD